MSRLLILSPILSLLLALPALAQPKEAETTRRGPLFQMVGGLDQDLGDIPAEEMKHMVYVTNLGDDTLRILQVRTGDPILPILQDSIILPGDTGRIELRGPFAGYGPLEMRKSFTINTNDPDNENVTLRVRLRIVPDIMLHLPGDNSRSLRLLIVPLKPGHDTTITVTLEVMGDSSFIVSPASMNIINASEKRSDIGFSSNMVGNVRLQPGDKLDVALWFVMASGNKEKENQSFAPISLNVVFPVAGRPKPIDCSVIITNQ